MGLRQKRSKADAKEAMTEFEVVGIVRLDFVWTGVENL